MEGRCALFAASGPGQGESDDLVDMAGLQRQHHQAVHAQGDAGAFWHAVLQGSYQALVGWQYRALIGATQLLVGLEAPRLFCCIGQFEIAVGQLHALDEQLEARRAGYPVVAINHAGQCRLRCREGVDHGWLQQ